MRKRIPAHNLKWTCGWLTIAGLALCWWLPLPLRSAANDSPPGIYGNPEARFTIALYADLECPHCRVYLPQLQRWIVTNDHVNLAWHHLPLPQPEPAASREARLAECVGQFDGREGFWGAVVWVYLHTQGNGPGVGCWHVLPWRQSFTATLPGRRAGGPHRGSSASGSLAERIERHTDPAPDRQSHPAHPDPGRPHRTRCVAVRSGPVERTRAFQNAC